MIDDLLLLLNRGIDLKEREVIGTFLVAFGQCSVLFSDSDSQPIQTYFKHNVLFSGIQFFTITSSHPFKVHNICSCIMGNLFTFH